MWRSSGRTARCACKACPNTPAGATELVAWVARQHDGAVHACLEATGTYGDAPGRGAGRRGLYSQRGQSGHASRRTRAVGSRAPKPTAPMRGSSRSSVRRSSRRAWVPLPREVRTLPSVRAPPRRPRGHADAGAESARGGAGRRGDSRLDPACHRLARGRDGRAPRAHPRSLRSASGPARRSGICSRRFPGSGTRPPRSCSPSLGPSRAFARRPRARPLPASCPATGSLGTSVRPQAGAVQTRRTRACAKRSSIRRSSRLRHNPIIAAFGQRLRAKGKHKMVVDRRRHAEARASRLWRHQDRPTLQRGLSRPALTFNTVSLCSLW